MRSSRWATGDAGALNAKSFGRVVWVLLTALLACIPATAGPPARLADTRDNAAQRYGDSVPAPPAPAPPPIAAPPQVPGPLPSRPNDQLWMVSCRGLPATDREQNFARLGYWRYAAPSGWVAASRDEFLFGGDSVSHTSVFVPGNGYSANQARDLGGIAYRRLVTRAPHEQALRFVIWSWPSDHVNAGPVQDARIKAARTTTAAWYLARWLDDLEPLSKVSIIGCSFGARVVGEALQLRGGGRLGAYQLAEPATTRSPVTVILVSAAIDNDWLLPGRRLERALMNAERLLLINNTTDSVLRRYGWLYGRRNSAAALGYTGLLALGRLGNDASKVRQMDATDIVGRRHGFLYYFSAPRIVAWMQPYVFGSSGGGSEVASQRLTNARKNTSARWSIRAANR